MRKLLLSLLAVSSTAAFGVANNSEFQEFDNQISLGWGMNSTTSNAATVFSGTGAAYSSNGNMLNMEGERLFNSGVWVDVNANMQFGGGETTPSIATTPYIAPAYGLNGKVGYAFPLAGQHILLTPYALLGINSNVNSYVSDVFTATPANSANSFYYTAGVGGRLEYRVNRWLELFADQNATYNWDQSQPQAGIAPQNFASYTSTLGAKFNLAPNFQLGVRGWYTDYEQASGSGAVSNSTLGTGNIAQATSGYGGLVSVGLTY